MKKKIPMFGLILAASSFCLPPLFSQQPSTDDADSAASQSSAYQPAGLAPPDRQRPVPVKAAFHLLSLHGIDDEAETFKFSGILTLTWNDPRQAFDPANEGFDERFFHGTFQFNELSPAWYPQVVLANATEFDNSQGVILRVKADGTSILSQTITAEARSRLDLRRYPLDKQTLKAEFEILGFREDEVILEAGPDAATADLAEIQVPQWDLTGLGATVGSKKSPSAGEDAQAQSSVFILNLETDRQAFFMIRLVIVPLVFIVCLSFSVFWMDRSSLGDRMAVSFVGILTAVAYQSMVSDIMPQISYVTLMNAILNFSFFVMCATVIINLAVGELDKHSKHGVSQRGERLDLRCRWLFPLIYAGLLVISVVISFLWF